MWTSSYCSGSARLTRVCVPCVKRIRRRLQFSSLLILVVGSSFSPSSMLSNWHLALQFWPRMRRQGCQLTVCWRCSSSWRGKEMKFCPEIEYKLSQNRSTEHKSHNSKAAEHQHSDIIAPQPAKKPTEHQAFAFMSWSNFTSISNVALSLCRYRGPQQVMKQVCSALPSYCPRRSLHSSLEQGGGRWMVDPNS